MFYGGHFSLFKLAHAHNQRKIFLCLNQESAIPAPYRCKSHLKMDYVGNHGVRKSHCAQDNREDADGLLEIIQRLETTLKMMNNLSNALRHT